jgi:SAM-dependent methyltransferase
MEVIYCSLWQRVGQRVRRQPTRFYSAPLDRRTGCGIGRNSYWPLRYGAAGGVAVDIDERSLKSARRNLKPFPTMQVMRMSAYDLPFEDRFDLAFSIGVVHHLERPERALERMVPDRSAEAA